MANADNDEPRGGSADPEGQDQNKTTLNILPVIDSPTTQYKRHLLQSRDNPWSTRITRIAVTTTTQTKPAEEACLVLIYPPGPDMGQRFPLTQSEVVLGRGRDCNIHVDRDSVSRRHARVFRRGKDWAIEDLKSTNGSYVNDIPVNQLPLRNTDQIKIGAAIFKFLVGSGTEASYQEEIYRLKIIDALTGAHNKRYLLELLERELVRSTQYGRSLSVLMIDIDHFKQLNAKHGHLAGDYVLREISRRIASKVRREQLFARYGGEEFVIVLPEHDLAAARELAEQTRRIVSEQTYDYDGEPLAITVSVGIACCGGEAIDATAFLQIAEDNLRRAKDEGRDRVVAGAEAWERWQVAPSFRSALTGKMAIAALSLLGRDQFLASAGAGAAALVGELEGLLYSRLREHERSDQRLSFGALEGGALEGSALEGSAPQGGKLLVALDGPSPVHQLRALLASALRQCVEERPEARFAAGPVERVGEGARAIDAAVAGLEAELGALEDGHHLPQPVAMAMRAMEGVTPDRAEPVLELGETLVQWLALCAAAELTAAGRRPAETLAPLRRCLTGGAAGAAPEGWLEALMAAVEELLGLETVHHAAWRASLGERSTREQVRGWLRSFATMRDAFRQGGADCGEQVARKLVDDIAPRLRQLVRRELRPLLALVPAELELVGFDGELQSYRMTRLIGGGAAPSVLLCSRQRMNAGLWLCDASADRAVPLEPFVVRDTCPQCGARELFLLSRLDKLELRNPASGHALGKPAGELPIPADAKERLLAPIR